MAGRMSMTAAALALACGGAFADTLKVPSDEFPTIQSAVDAADEGDVILVGPGDYESGVAIVEASGIVLKGKGNPTLVGGNLSIFSCSGVTVSGFTLEGPGGAGVHVDDSTGIVLDRVTVRQSQEYDARVASNCVDVTFSRCRFETPVGYGIIDEGSDGLTVDRCLLENSTVMASGNASEGEGSTGVTVSRNRFTGQFGFIEINGADATVSGNRMDGDVRIIVGPGIPSPGLVVEKNRLTTANRNTNLLHAEGPGAIVSRNALAYTDTRVSLATGIRAIGTGAVVEGNRVVGLRYGIWASGSELVVEGNAVTGPVVGIYLSSGSSCTVRGNRVANHVNEGFLLDVSESEISGNRTSGAGTWGFWIGGILNTVTGNRASGNTNADCGSYEAESSNTYEGNRFGTTQFDVPE